MTTPTCPDCGNDDQGALAGHEIRGIYDGVLFWSCLECGFAWPRNHGIPSRDEAARRYARSYMGE